MGRIFESPVALILILLVVLLFGAKRLPDLARGVGRSLRIFKAETDGLRTDGAPEPTESTVLQATQEPAAPQPSAPAPQAAIAPPAPAPAQPAPAPVQAQPTVTYSVGPQVSQSAPAPSTPPQGSTQA